MNIPPGTLQPPSAGARVLRGSAPHEASGPKEAAAPAPPPAQAQAAAPAQAPLSSEAVKKVAQHINDFLKSTSASLEFSVERDSSEVLVRIVDTQTKELIRQIPSEEMLAISKALDKMSGLLIQQRA